MHEEMEKVKGVPGGQERALHREAENSVRHCEPQDLQLSAAEGRLVQSYNQSQCCLDLSTNSTSYNNHACFLTSPSTCSNSNILDVPHIETVGFRSNFKKIPTHTQDHGDA